VASDPARPSLHGRKAEVAAATAVVRRYYALLNAPTAEATVASLRALMTKTCSCQQVVGSIRAAIRRHEHYVGTGRVVAYRPVLDSRHEAEVLVNFDSTPGGLVGRSGRYVAHTEARRGVTQNVYLITTRRGWLMNEIELVSTGQATHR
jgi:hypothetical protein